MVEPLSLTLVRHAKSSWQVAGLDDFHRPLNRRGLADAVRMPAHIAKHVAKPQLVCSSAAVRAVQTCQSLCDEYAIANEHVLVDSALYLASAEEVLDYLCENAQHAQRVFVIGHNPGLTDLFNHLVDEKIDNLPTFAVANLNLAINDWSAVTARCASVQRLMLPREIRCK